MNSAPRELKILVAGDGYTGKTSMVLSFINGVMKDDFDVTAISSYCKALFIDGEQLIMHITDISGTEDYDALRVKNYPGKDVIVLCYSVVNPTSYINVIDRWIPEIRKNGRGTHVILVGLQTDRRANAVTLANLEEQGHAPITKKQGMLLAAHMKADAFYECSMFDQSSIKEGLENGIRTILAPRQAGSCRCSII